MPSSREDLHKDIDVEVQYVLPKSIIKPWEEILNNRNKISLGYGKGVYFNILYYSNPIQFQSFGFLHDS